MFDQEETVMVKTINGELKEIMEMIIEGKICKLVPDLS